MNFEDIQSIDDLETVSEEAVWQNFECLTGFIFEKNNFEVIINTVKTWNKKRRQYDVIARKSGQTFLIECKKWAGNRYRLSALKGAIKQHKERTTFYTSITGEDAIPIIVTQIEEEIRLHEGVPIVPVQKLNSFISELDHHILGNSFEETILVPDEMPEQSGESGACAERSENYILDYQSQEKDFDQ